MSGAAPGPAWRLLVHALDRTGPPVLVRTFLRWLAEHHPGDQAEVVAFRGGHLEPEIRRLVPLHVVLDPEEPWDHHRPDPGRVAILTARLAGLAPVSATLLVSTSASQILPLLPTGLGPVVTWSVEIGEDLHWFDDPVDLVARTDRWLAGSETTRRELVSRLGEQAVGLAPEFVAPPGPGNPVEAQRWRRELGVADDEVLVVAAGIATWRKGIDLFVELAAACRRRGLDGHLAWVGGERDPLFPLATAEVVRLGLEQVHVLAGVADLDPVCGAADVFVHTARVDAFPLVALHASQAGTPVVSFAGTGGVEEMFGPHFCGAPYPDIEGLVDQLVMLRDAGRRRELARLQRSHVEAHTVAAAAPGLRSALLAAAAAGEAA
ncbi:MAG: hypothetical protein JWM47_1568, partial [Acidimicrobiales bacterium]|nr:hypothetical protein [Acidimicrobiales bacterium]